MLKFLTICAASCAFLLAETEASYYDLKSLQLEFSHVFTNNNNLYTVWQTEDFLHVNSTDKNVKPCTIAIDKRKTPHFPEVKALNDDRRFIIYGLRDVVTDETEEGTVNTYYAVLIIEPSDCSYKSVPEVVNKRPSNDSYRDIFVVTNTETFDVFLPNNKSCSPCRFDVNGEKIELQHQLKFSNPKLAPFVTPHGIHIEPIHPINRKLGYFFARNFENSTSVIEHLDEDFQTLKQSYVDHPVHSMSISSSKNPLISICYASHNIYSNISSKPLEVHCQLLNSDFQSNLSIRLPAPKNDFVIGLAHLTHQIDAMGNIYVGVLETDGIETEYILSYRPQLLRFFAYDKTGKLFESRDFYETPTRSMTKGSERIGRFLYSYLLDGDNFCMAYDEYCGEAADREEFITCFDIHNYYASV